MSALTSSLRTSALSAALRAALGASALISNPIYALAADGTQGAYFDYNDTTLMFQETAGTTPAAVEQPVGAALDKLGGNVLSGIELVTNGTGGSTTGWTSSNSTLSVAAGRLVITATAAGTAARATQTLTCVVGRTYEFSFKARRTVANTVACGAFISAGATAFTAYSTTTTETFRKCAFVATSTNVTIALEMAATGVVIGDAAEFDDISVQEVVGRTNSPYSGFLNPDPEFDDPSKWGLTQPAAGSTTISGGQCVINTTDGSYAAAAATTLSIVPGRTYELVVWVSAVATGGFTLEVGGVAALGTTSPGMYRFQATAATNGVANVKRKDAGVPANFTVTRMTVREVLGAVATQGTAAARPTLSARKNRLTKSEQLDDAIWTKTGCTVTPQSGTMDAIVESTGVSELHQVTQNSVAVTAGQPVTMSWRVRVGGRARVYVDLPNSAVFGGINPAALFDLNTGQVVGTPTASSASIVPLGGGDYRVTVSHTATVAGTTGARLGASDAVSGGTYVGDGRIACYVGEAQFEFGNAASRYQRVNTATDYDTVGFPHYLRFDGVDDWLQFTIPILFTSGGTIAHTLRTEGVGTVYGANTVHVTNNVGFGLADAGTPQQVQAVSGSGTAFATPGSAGVLSSVHVGLGTTSGTQVRSRHNLTTTGGPTANVLNHNGNTYRIGRTLNDGGVLKGEIHNTLVLSRVYTTAQEDALIRALAAAGGLTL